MSVVADEAGDAPCRGAGCGIGAQLRSARERIGLTVAQAAQRLHVAGETLEALEAERFEALGAPIYVKGYVGRYAELLGESPEALQAQLTSAAMMPEPDLRRVPHAFVRVQSRRPTAMIVVSAIIVLIVAGGLGWWAWSRRHAGLAVPMLLSQTAPQRPATSAASPTARTESTRSAASAARHADAAAPAKATTAVTGSVHITLQFPGASWAAVTDATGHHLYRGMVSAGATKSFAGRAPLHVVLGYADGVTLVINGHATPIGRFVGRDHAVSIAVGAGGRVSPVPWHAGG